MNPDIFLSLYGVKEGERTGLLAFLVLADSEDEAVTTSDEFVDNVNAASSRKSDLYTSLIAQEAIFAMQRRVCFITDLDEMGLISRMISQANPALATVLSLHEGGVFTVRIDPEEGFPVETADRLRKRMVKHHFAASLSVCLA